MSSVYVVGVGMIPFTKPGREEPYAVMGERAARAALEDAGVEYAEVHQAYAGYVYGDSTSGQAALYGLGQSGIPIVNVNNNCATGSTALWQARQAIASGAADCVLVLGFEQMRRGALVEHWDDRPSPMARSQETMAELQGHEPDVPLAARFFGGAGREYMRTYDVGPEVFAKVSVKARRHAAANPYAVFREPLTVEEVLASPAVYGPLTRLLCCPPTCGAAAAVLCSAEFARSRGLRRDVRIRAQAMVTDVPGTFTEGGMMTLAGAGMARAAADQVYRQAGLGPEDVQVAELHDCFATNEVISYEALRLVPEGEAEKFVADGQNTYGGRIVTNPSGGLLAKGHPLGATGLAQCAELTWQLRGEAGGRQVEGAAVALQHNLGLGGACVVTMYEKAGK
ncbi:lipid-transfer protein [Sinosporangium siamense]|uniref:propanoyl-CoA C-acyltransferase n=1 Tax=Sinosporangium siamense TaxID=1367973 RepID=A0A919VCB0_9ACTN|nr:lipid-transfer protein [Sinosporangium siamense]GII92959.1 lipid-transfer protein [Sinosporangium siamense]